MIFKVFYDVPKIRQESHHTCWFAAAQMVRGSFLKKSEWAKFIETNAAEQRKEGQMGLASSSLRFEDRLRTGELYPKRKAKSFCDYFKCREPIAPYVGEDERKVKVKDKKDLGFDPTSAVHLRELKNRYGMEKLLLPSTVDAFKLATSLLFHLTNLGPLMVSVPSGVNSYHMVCITGFTWESMLSSASKNEMQMYDLDLNVFKGLNKRNKYKAYLHVVDPEGGRAIGLLHGIYKSSELVTEDPDLIQSVCSITPVESLMAGDSYKHIFYFKDHNTLEREWTFAGKGAGELHQRTSIPFVHDCYECQKKYIDKLTLISNDIYA
ncbi:MAG: hypothetical protein GY750_19475 [Lentisphaerae bacterium]|nr:hypothetical protein [Lentisphaerota bacterium]MCP4103578.1 hypothetical protein [Lentisphaerota bacterium]